MEAVYDCLARISWLNAVLHNVVDQLNLQSKLLDLCGDYVNTCLPTLISLLYKALGTRVTLVAAKPSADATVNLLLI